MSYDDGSTTRAPMINPVMINKPFPEVMNEFLSLLQQNNATYLEFAVPVPE